jgi:hypothetical protein
VVVGSIAIQTDVITLPTPTTTTASTQSVEYVVFTTGCQTDVSPQFVATEENVLLEHNGAELVISESPDETLSNPFDALQDQYVLTEVLKSVISSQKEIDESEPRKKRGRLAKFKTKGEEKILFLCENHNSHKNKKTTFKQVKSRF